MNIPIKNIYYLILYAFDKVKNKDVISNKDFEDVKDFEEIIIELFIEEANKIVKKGLFRNYNEISEDLNLIKGKVDIKKTLLLTNGKLACNYDEFNSNNDYNKLLKFIINRLLFVKNISLKNQKRLRTLYFSFDEIELGVYTVNDFNKIKFNRLNSNYSFVIRLAAFIISNTIPTDKKGNYEFINFFENEEVMSTIFENFLLNFYKINSDCKVKGNKKYNWYLTPIEKASLTTIPQMETDIELIKGNDKIIIDAKYYKNAFSNRFNCHKHLSNNMYQMNTYLDHNVGIYDKLRGILLYPSNGYSFNNKYGKENKSTIEFATVDLSKDWKEIEANLLLIIK